MPLTPSDVHTVTFSKPPLGRSGYHEDEVDDFLDRVETELARLTEDNTTLRSQVAQLDQQLRALSTETPGGPDRPRPPGPVTTPLRRPVTEGISPDADHDRQAGHALVLAQETADQVTEQAHADADQVLGQARTDCEQLLASAQHEAEALVTEARNQAEAILQQARTAAETLQLQSQDNAASLTQEATCQRTTMLDALDHDKSLLETTIDELRAFELGYRTQLATYLHSLIYQLDGPRSAAQVNPSHPQPDLACSGPDTCSQSALELRPPAESRPSRRVPMQERLHVRE